MKSAVPEWIGPCSTKGRFPLCTEGVLFSGHRGYIHLVKELGKLVGGVLFMFFVGLEHSDCTSQKLEGFVGNE